MTSWWEGWVVGGGVERGFVRLSGDSCGCVECWVTSYWNVCEEGGFPCYLRAWPGSRPVETVSDFRNSE